MNDKQSMSDSEIKERIEEIKEKLDYRPGIDMHATMQYYIFYKEDVRFLLNLLEVKSEG